MRLTKRDLNEAVAAGVVTPATADQLWTFLVNRGGTDDRPRFDLTNLLWYVGALIVMSAMGLFSTEAFNRWGGAALTATALVYGAVFIAAGHYFWRVRGIRILGGLLIAVAVSMAPLATYGIQEELGWWTHGDPGAYRDFFVWVRGSWLFMSLSAIAAGLVALRFYRFPFITMLIAVALWFLSMDLVPWFAAAPPDPSDDIQSYLAYWRDLRELRGIVSTHFGLLVLIVSWAIDVRARADLTFWPHLAAGLCIVGGLFFWLTDGIQEWTLLCAVSVVLLLVSVFLQRRSYAVVGGIGVLSYLGYLSSEVFDDVIVFSFALTAVGILVMALGYVYFRNERRLEVWLDCQLPGAVKRLRPQR